MTAFALQTFFHYLVLVALLESGFNVYASVDRCTNGGLILKRGVTSSGEVEVVNAHNYFRGLVCKGVVHGQPKATFMETISYDPILAKKAEPVSNQCIPNHIIPTDDRYRCVGQCLYNSWSSQLDLYQNWTEATESWFLEHEDFQFPNISINGGMIGHYTQLVWALSKVIGCDFVLYIDDAKPRTPYAKMYTCNYGPCGNYNHLPPYVVDDGKPTTTTTTTRTTTTSTTIPPKTQECASMEVKTRLQNMLSKLFGFHH